MTKSQCIGPGSAFVIFLLTQVGDGLFTYIGVAIHGVGVEGNPLLHFLMAVFGVEPSIIAVKLIASGCGALLYLLQVHRMLLVLDLVYLVVAFIPWACELS